MEHELNEREREILKLVVCDFIARAMPVASRQLARDYDLGLSAASIRNTLADLEFKGFITHPHTSAGRIPTDKGYRYFVDNLMDVQPLTRQEKGDIKKQLDGAAEPDDLLRHTAKLLGVISHQLSIVSHPHLKSGVLERIELIPVASNKIFVILTIESGLVKTITMEMSSDISQEKITDITRLLNERLAGLTLETIRDTFTDRVRDFKDEHPGVINVFIRSADKIFNDAREREKLHIGGTQSLIEQPEYGDPANIRSMIELINNENVLIHVLESRELAALNNGIVVSIGGEHEEELLKNYSIVVSTYNAGGIVGSIGIIGPRRMDYQKVVPLVNYIAREVSSSLG